jgi:hypothetical protein
MARRERTYRGIFEKTNGERVGLDFYAENRDFALTHAEQVAQHIDLHKEQGPLIVVKVSQVDVATFRAGDAGSWFPVEGR